MRSIFLLLWAICFFISGYTQVPATKANYPLASRFSPKKLEKMIFSTAVDPHWLKKSNRFWYMYETTNGKNWYIIDPAKAEKRLLFDNVKMAALLTALVKDPMDAQHLNIDSLRFVRDENWIQFEVKSSEDSVVKDTVVKKGTSPKTVKKKYYFEYNIISGQLVQLSDFKRPKRTPVWASLSPDGQTILFVRKYNLYWMNKANYEKALQNEDDSTITEHQITKDGVEYFSYGTDNFYGGGETNVDKEKNKNKRKPAGNSQNPAKSEGVFWSPDSKHFVIVRADTRAVKELWVINSAAEPRPTLETYKYWMPGEKEAPVEYVLLFDNTTKTYKELNIKEFKDQDIAVYSAPERKSHRDDDWKPYLWLGTNDKFYFVRTSRDLKRIDLCTVDITSGKVNTLIPERLNTYVEVKRPGLINNGSELIEWSERDGWAHFYLYDGNGNLKNQITSGPFHSENIAGIDENKKVLYFTANGREPNEDPYYLHLYRVNFDGSGLRLLNPGEFEHSSNMNDDEQYFIDNYSRVNTIPKSTLFNNEGKKIMDLETADLTSLFAAGYKFPQVFKVKADDGITNLYGVLYKPFDFDSTKKYPIIEYVYPGPQTEAVNKAFSRNMNSVDRLAQLGFIVISVGNRGGNPQRSKWYHSYGYGNLRDYGLADKKAAAEQLADRYSFIDIDRVGIYGHSGGGFMSTAAMLVYPDFFKVAVSSSGNHDNSIYNRWWSEKHNGVKEFIGEKGDTSFAYNIEKNPDLAKNLKGHLLLTTGDIDNNVNPANTIRMVNALERANKRFDLLLLPGQRHAYGDLTEYFFWKMADYFSRYLLGYWNQPVDIIEMNREEPREERKKSQ